MQTLAYIVSDYKPLEDVRAKRQTREIFEGKLRELGISYHPTQRRKVIALFRRAVEFFNRAQRAGSRRVPVYAAEGAYAIERDELPYAQAPEQAPVYSLDDFRPLRTQPRRRDANALRRAA